MLHLLVIVQATQEDIGMAVMGEMQLVKEIFMLRE
jgi:hypothetical protein